jgi:N-acetyl-S-(2-succino)cysteine monooxygenase
MPRYPSIHGKSIMSQRKLRLGAFIQATGHHIAGWRHPGSQADSGINIDH